MGAIRKISVNILIGDTDYLIVQFNDKINTDWKKD